MNMYTYTHKESFTNISYAIIDAATKRELISNVQHSLHPTLTLEKAKKKLLQAKKSRITRTLINDVDFFIFWFGCFMELEEKFFLWSFSCFSHSQPLFLLIIIVLDVCYCDTRNPITFHYNILFISQNFYHRLYVIMYSL